MSYGQKFPLKTARALAERACKDLTPMVRQIAIVGSVRRRVEMVGDIELLVRPLMQTQLFGETAEPVLDGIKAKLWKMGRWVRGAQRYMKITDLYDHKGMSLDVFLVHPPSEWGTQKLIRTGSRQFSTRMATRLKDLGTPFRDGRILDLNTGETIPTPTEEDVFRIAKVGYKPPEYRNW